MILGRRSLYDLSIDDFQILIDTKVPEGPNLDYKETAYSGRADDIREMLRDISALANADGGYLIMGVKEDRDSRAESFSPIKDLQIITQSIRQTCLDGIQERIPNLEILGFEVSPNNGIIVVYVPISSQRPHMVSREHRTDFFRRYGTDKRSMTISEIRDTFLSNPTYRRFIELELLAREKFGGGKISGIEGSVTYLQLLTDNSVEKFLCFNNEKSTILTLENLPPQHSS